MQKKVIALLLLLTACSSNENTTPSNAMNKNSNNAQQTKQITKPMKVYDEKITAFICDTSKKGDFTYCDVKGEEITGIVRFENGSYVYYEDGAEVDGVAIYPNNQVRTYHKRSKDDKVYTIVNYYADGSIASIDIANKETGRESAQYTKGTVYNAPQQQMQLDKFTEVVESENK